MHGATHFEPGIDHSCDAVVMRWFKWRFPMLNLQRFIACRQWPYELPHHIIEMEGNSHVFVNLGILAPQLIPRIWRTRTTRQFKIRRLSENKLDVSMLIWSDAPLKDSHPLAKLCPSRWPIMDELPAERIGHLEIIQTRRREL
jgi:hypothetical protein